MDRGGTFTDCLARDPLGRLHRCKILSSGKLRAAVREVSGNRVLPAAAWAESEGLLAGWAVEIPGIPLSTVAVGWRDGWLTLASAAGVEPGMIMELSTGEPAPVAGARLLTGTAPGTAFPPLEYRLATTLATNALLEGAGARTALFITRGFGDLLVTGDQRRADLFALGHVREAPLYTVSVELAGRMDAGGAELEPLDESGLREAAERLVRSGITSAAVALAHSDVNPAHELAAGRILEEAGFRSVSLSSVLSPVIRLLPRAQTAVVNAVLAPVMEEFISSVRAPLGGGRFLLMSSNGGLETPDAFRPRDSLLSGPAGGIAGCAATARACGERRILTLDMGGTSTDTARWEGRFVYQFEQRVGRAVILAPALRIETVAAGGGSICEVRGGELTVGPRSAGAEPGPACYGRGGPLTLTDVNLLLGRLDPDKAGIPLMLAPARQRLGELQESMRVAGLAVPESEAALLHGLRDIAVARMAGAVRSISVRDGCDPREYTLVAFGGAGPQHACSIADQLQMTRILIPAGAGVLSAAGVLHAAVERSGVRQVLEPFAPARALALLRELEENTLAAVRTSLSGHGTEISVSRRMAELRLAGQEAALTLDFAEPGTLPEAFADAHFRQYGYAPPAGRALELVSLRVVAGEVLAAPEPEEFSCPAEILSGPALVQDTSSTMVVEPGWQAAQGSRGTWLLTRTAPALPEAGQAVAVAASLFRCRLQGMVDAMGELLRRTAVSTNIRERLDYSCALLDAAGRLVLNAPHIPVHLGALGECVRRAAAVLPPEPGDVFITNDPAAGGSHLPDITVLCPVFSEGGKLLAWTASRAHHAETGGITPGSMPPDASCLAEEGVVIPPMHLLRAGVSHADQVLRLLTEARWPSRAPADNMADIRAQLASVRHGADAFLQLCASHGEAVVTAQLTAITAQAREAFRRRLAAVERAPVGAVSTMDDGTPLAVRIDFSGGRMHLDFTGSGGVHPGSLNAGPAILRSVILYVLRLWTGEDLALNEGPFDLVDVTVPPGLLSPPFHGDPSLSPAVVGGNVETSQCLASLLITALDLEAGSQGTMNNVIFGNAAFGHYETICGGSGAGPGWHGTDAIHTHMTNTAITDVEVLERRFPVRLREFRIRPGSGGGGEWRGGHGAIRVYEFLAPVTVSLLTGHRRKGPAGRHGGLDGSPGAQFLHRSGKVTALEGICRIECQPGDVLEVQTPGGGGWGQMPSVA